MQTWRVPVRAIAMILVTGIAAAVPSLVRLLTLGALRPSTWAGAYASRAWGWLACRILGIRVDVSGPRPSGCFLVASNHLSYLDILVLASLYTSVFVAKREIASWPVFGWIARGSGTLFVDRERPKDVVRAGRAMEERLRARIPLTLFPEGRSTPGREVLPFLSPLLQPAATVGVPCHAVSLSYDTPAVPLPPSVTVCWYDKVEFVPHFVRLLGLPRIEATVCFAATPFTSTDRKELAQGLESGVRENFRPVRQVALEAAS